VARTITVAVDAMGGDHGPPVTVPAAIGCLRKYPELHLILVGQSQPIQEVILASGLASSHSDRWHVHEATQVVLMDESPASAMRSKKDSSMRVAINLVHEGKADACVSAGNTGALMATAKFVLKTIPGIDRPAICTAVPATSGFTHVLDLGANVNSSAEQLFQFAVMGEQLVAAVTDKKNPTVGLLNIGQEDMKGIETVKNAAKLLADSSINYVGFVEGDDIYAGSVDVVVCDGFVGNVALKTSEGVAKMVTQLMRQAFKKNLLTMLCGLVAAPVLRAVKSRIDPRRYNGASLVGLRKIVIKSHGGADPFSFSNAIGIAIDEVENDVAQRIGMQVEQLLSQRQVS